MSATGIQVQDDCVSKFNDMKLNKSARYIIYGMDDKLSNIVVLSVGDRSKTFKDFTNELPSDQTRYGVVDFEYENPDGMRSKLIFVIWCPDNAKIKHKMVFAGSKATLKDKLVGISFEIQATDQSEVDAAVVQDKCNQFSK